MKPAHSKFSHLSFLCFCLACILLFWFAHISIAVFWITLPVVSALLILYSVFQTKLCISKCSISEGLVSLCAGIGLYLIFWIGNQLGNWIYPALFSQEVPLLYQSLQPQNLLSWILLFILIIPAEEIIWRGVVLEKLLYHMPKSCAVLCATALYMLSLVFSISPLLVLAGMMGGLLWSKLYTWRKNIILPLLSHLIFDLFLLVLLPL